MGAFISEFPAPNLVRLMQASGLDFAILDCEHGYFSDSQVAAIAAVANGIQFPLIVRVPNVNREHIQKFLDAGVDGILVPMLETVEQATSLVKFGKYFPEGARGVSTMRPHSNYNPGELKAYMHKANKGVMLYAQIETKLGIENADAIAKTPGIDGLILGPNDLSCDFGSPGEIATEEMMNAYKKVVADCNKHNKVSGIITTNMDVIHKCEKMGMSVFSCNSELGFISQAIKSMLKTFFKD